MSGCLINHMVQWPGCSAVSEYPAELQAAHRQLDDCVTPACIRLANEDPSNGRVLSTAHNPISDFMPGILRVLEHFGSYLW